MATDPDSPDPDRPDPDRSEEDRPDQDRPDQDRPNQDRADQDRAGQAGPGRPDQPDVPPGNPFEQLMAAFGGGAPGGPGGPSGSGGPAVSGPGGGLDLSALFGQLQQWLAPHEGTVNWPLAGQVARQVVARRPDPSPGRNQRSAVQDAVRLADLWLDGVTDLPSGVTVAAAWSRAEWVEETRPVWERVVEPVAEHVVAAMGQAVPDEVRRMAGPLVGFLGQAGGAMFGQQLGQALGELGGEVVSGSDVGLPLAPAGTAAVLLTNVDEFGAGLGQQPRDVLLYVALRECAHQRLFVHVPWLSGHLFGAVDAYARGTRIDLSAIEETVRGIDPTNPAALQEALSEGMFEPRSTPEQEAALDRLATLLALVEGWVDEVVAQATVDRMPSAPALREAMRRRRASGGPAEQAFASLVGLELRPRRLRDAATLWGALRDRHGAQGRDRLWQHPDLLPSSADLDDPLGFAHGERPGDVGGTEGDQPASGAEFDAAVRALLERDDGPADGSGDGPAEDSGDPPRP